MMLQQLVRDLKIQRMFHKSYRCFSNISENAPRFVVTQILLEAKENRKITFKELAQNLNVNKVWLTSVILGQHPADLQTAKSLLEALSPISKMSSEECIAVLVKPPENRGVHIKGVTKDPIVRRFDELLDVYGEVFKAIIREEAGDGIMSAIDCALNFEASKRGDEVRIILNVDGKFLKYKH